MSALRLYDVSVRWGDFNVTTSSAYAKSAAAARYDAFRCDAFSGITFREFLRISRVRTASRPPTDDCYGYIRRNYGLDIEVGQAVTIERCSKDLDGRTGTVAYPGTSTAHVHVLVEGYDRPLILHPYDVSLAASPLPAPSSVERAG